MSTKRDREKPQQIQVFVRTRPLSTQEREIRQTSCIEIIGSKELSVRQQHGRKYAFDRVFAPHVKQVDVYKAVVYPLISEVLAGYNCTVFAYGQTGSGKTHTMVGDSCSNFEVPWQDDDSSGIVPRAMANLFEDLQLTQQEHTVRISYIELYNEEVYDLLAESDDNARIRLFEDQHQKGSVIIQGIEQVTVINNKDVKKILDKGQEKRRTAATLMNSQSSRSHTVFTITVHSREATVEGDVLVKTGKLNLVDLAGSENISRSGAVEKRAREAGSINQSLLTLGRVIKSLVERSGHVPYRESKLTRILQDSLGGRTKTSIIATISPAVCNLEETLSTLEYANRARNITNRPEVNQRMSQKAVMGQYLEELEKLRKDLQATRSGHGVYLAQENYEQLIADNDNDKQELSLKIQHIRDLEKNLKELEDQRDEFRLNWIEINNSFEKTNNELSNCRDRLVETENEKNQQEFLAIRYEEKAGQLYDEVQSLVTIIKTSKNIDAALREKIDKLYTTAKENRNAANQMRNRIKNKFEDMCDDIANFKETCKMSKDHACDVLNDIANKQGGYFDTNEKFMDDILHHWRTYATSHQTFAQNSQTDFECWMQQFTISCNNRVTEIRKQREEEKLLLNNLRVVVQNKNLEQNQNFTKMRSQLENGHQATTDLCKHLEEDFTNQTNDLLTDVSELKVSTEKQIDCKHMEEQIALGQEAIKGIQKSLEMLHSNFAMLQSTCNASKEENSSNLSTVHKLECAITNLGSFGDISVKNVIHSTEENFSLLQKSLDNAEKIQVSSKNSQTKLLDTLDSNNIKIGENIEEALVENIDKQKDIFLVKQRNIFNKDNLELMTQGNELTNFVVNQTKQIKDIATELNLNLSDAHNCVQDFANSASEFEVQLSKDLGECQETISTFTNVKYKEIRPTGDTPVKMQYYCPNLNPPTPKEKILGRFQERLHTMQTIDEPNVDTETVN